MGNKKEACPRQCRTYDISTDTIAREKIPPSGLHALSNDPLYLGTRWAIESKCVDHQDEASCLVCGISSHKFRVHNEWVYANFLQQCESPRTSANCTSCKATVATIEEDQGCVQLDKWALCIRDNENIPWEDYQVQQFLCSQFLALIENQATYRYVVYNGNLENSSHALSVGAISKLCS